MKRLLLSILFTLAILPLSSQANITESDHYEEVMMIFRDVFNNELTQYKHDRFWTIIYENTSSKEEANSEALKLKALMLDVQIYQLELFKMVKHAYVNKEIQYSDNYLEKRKVLESLFDKFNTLTVGSVEYLKAKKAHSLEMKKGFDNASLMLESAKKRESIIYMDGYQFDLSLNSIDAIISNIDLIVNRALNLLNPNWKA